MERIATSIKRHITSIKTGNEKYDISVIVPIYNTKRYLADCVESILSQTKTKVQIILVDDGSTDGSDRIGRAYEKSHRNIAYVRKNNTGVAATRNLGAKLATGTYLAFADSDDLLDSTMLERLFLIAEKTQAEIATCGMAHFNNRTTKKYPSPLFDNAFRGSQITCGSLEEVPNQLFNTSCCNKLFLRSFYESEKLHFPEGMVYEDLPFSITALGQASKIAVLPEKLYFYRVRTEDESSITQQRHDINNLKARLNASRMVLEYLNASKSSSLQKKYQQRAIEHDLKLCFRSIPETENAKQPSAIEEIATFVDECINSDVLNKCSDLTKLKIELCKNKNLELLKRIINYENGPHKKAPIHQAGTRLYTRTPTFLQSCPNIGQTIDVTRDVLWREPISSIEHVEANEDAISFWGCIYQNRISIPTSEQTYRAFLTDEFGKELVELPIKPSKPQAILKSHTIMRSLYDKESYDYSGCGFKIDVPKSVLMAGNDQNSMLVRIDYQNDIFSGSQYLSGPASTVKALESTFGFENGSDIFGVEFAQSGWMRISRQGIASKPSGTTKENANPAPDRPEEVHSTAPVLSIVVPVHGNDWDLVAALESIKTQTIRNMEVLLIDDGTSWNGSSIAQYLENECPPFKRCPKSPGTMGEACNYGVSLTKGDYIAFASPCDIMMPTAYEHLVNEAAKHDADFVAGDYCHYYDRGQTKNCNLARSTFDYLNNSQNLKDAKAIVYDTLPWNHLFARDFYIAANLSWPTDASFDDTRLMSKAHFTASSSCYLREIVMRWRRRNRDDLALARSTDLVSSLKTKIEKLHAADQLLAGLTSDNSILAENGFRRLDLDLRSDLLQLPSASNVDQIQCSTMIREYLATLPNDSFSKLRALERMKYQYVCQGDFDSLIKLREYELSDYKLLSVRKNDNGDFTGNFPFEWTDPSFFLMNEELKRAINTNTSEVSYSNNGLTIKGQIFPYRVPVPNKNEICISVNLVNIETGEQQKITVDLKKSKKGTRVLSSKESQQKLTLDQPYRSYAIEISPCTLDALSSGSYRIVADYSFRGLKCKPINLGNPLRRKDIKPLEFKTPMGRQGRAEFGLGSEIVITLA